MSRSWVIAIMIVAPMAWGASKDEGVLYSPVGKRDPFRAPTIVNIDRTPASKKSIDQYSIDQLKLRAVLRGEGGAKVMFEDPDGDTYILGQGDLVGREQGKISRILNTDVIITEKTFNYLGNENLYERVLTLPDNND